MDGALFGFFLLAFGAIVDFAILYSRFSVVDWRSGGRPRFAMMTHDKIVGI